MAAGLGYWMQGAAGGGGRDGWLCWDRRGTGVGKRLVERHLCQLFYFFMQFWVSSLKMLNQL